MQILKTDKFCEISKQLFFGKKLRD